MAMQPRFEIDAVRSVMLEQAGLVETQLAAIPDHQFDQPTRLGEWTVGVLVAHLALAFGALARWLAAPEPARSGLTLSTYYELGSSSAASVDDMSRAAAAGKSPAELRKEFSAAVVAVTAAVAGVAGSRLVETRIGAVLATDSLVTRCVEVVVHALDLQHATGVPATAGDAVTPAALGVCVKAMSAILQERAPGHSVEVRVPGRFGTAFQCGEGPQHTRGTPPNVIETDPVTFVELCAGRLSWSAAVASGAVLASGERADLTGLLPVVG